MARWTWGVLYVGLLTAITAYFVWRHDLETANQIGGLVGTYAALLGVPAAVVAARQAWRQEARPSLDDAAARLAVAVRLQWDEEAAVRRVNDPYPLPVTWRVADAPLTEPWSLLRDTARARPGGPLGDPARWPGRVTGLAGRDARIGEVFTDRIPTRRLVILGEPGAGKSILLIQLLQDLLERRAADDPIPVLFSLASWDPRQPLKGWLVRQLRQDHPGLCAPAQEAVGTGDGPGDLARALLDTGRILPLLDGFDELPPALHPAALRALNRALPTGQPLAMTVRTAAYRAALARPGTGRLNGAAAIRLRPVRPGQAAAYLRRDAGGPGTPGADRWNSVIAALNTDTPVRQALTTPLGLFLARSIYNSRPGQALSAQVRHPDELCDVRSFPDRAAVDRHLFTAFVPAAYASDTTPAPRWPPAQADRVLTVLARFLADQRHGSPDLAWWELARAVPAVLRRLIASLVVGLLGAVVIGAVAGLTNGIGAGIVLGSCTGVLIGLLVGCGGGAELVGGLLAGFTFLLALGSDVQLALRAGLAVVVGFLYRYAFVRAIGRMPHLGVRAAPPSTALHFSSAGLAAGPAIGGVTGLLAGVVAGPATGCALGLAFGLVGALLFVLVPEKPDLASSVGPTTVFLADRRALLTFGLGGGLGMGLVCGLVGEAVIGAAFGARPGIGLAAGLVAGLVAGAVAGLLKTAWIYFAAARLYLTVRYGFPFDLMAFMADAHRHRGVLRQVGAVYQFRHIQMQRHLLAGRAGAHLPAQRRGDV